MDFDEDEAGVITVKNETAGLYRFFDASSRAEALARWVEQTVKVELRAELDFVVRFRETRRALEAIVELPDRSIDLFIKLCRYRASREARRDAAARQAESRARRRAKVTQQGSAPLATDIPVQPDADRPPDYREQGRRRVEVSMYVVAAVPAAPASVDGFAARAHARALQADLGRDVVVLEHERAQLKGRVALAAGSLGRCR